MSRLAKDAWLLRGIGDAIVMEEPVVVHFLSFRQSSSESSESCMILHPSHRSQVRSEAISIIESEDGPSRLLTVWGRGDL